MRLSLIYARSRNHCIGRAGGLPWQLPDEYAHFERTTRGHAIIMGRLSYEDHNCLLAQRLNIVVTRSPSYRAAPGIVLSPSLDHAITTAAHSCREVFIIGGAALLKTGFERAQRVFETVVETDCEGDVFLEPFEFSPWNSQELEYHPPDREHAFAYRVYEHWR